ncbi:MAG: hypothetical protein CL935_01390 [Deltaproteobacteria bacterium]|nr:hypothetical protein [Deltaproteobacteria bacterium]|tara:strand:+ start:1427 stop:2128 length:702 start_codon:yes stop_codon:yes gene_type:complete
MTFEQRIKWFSEREMIMMFLWKNHFQDPQIFKQQNIIKSSGLLDSTVMKVLEEYLPKLEDELPKGMYFPIPISRSIKQGEQFSKELALKFHYDFINVDQKQQWSLMNKRITGKVLSLFKSNIYFEETTGLYFVEYWNETYWDKCYLDCAITPMLALAIYRDSKGFRLQLNNNKSDMIYQKSFRMDNKERFFVQSENFGEVLLADAPRFWVLDHLDDTGKHIVLKENQFTITFS